MFANSWGHLIDHREFVPLFDGSTALVKLDEELLGTLDSHPELPIDAAAVGMVGLEGQAFGNWH
eukprot:913094-Amorphochlora_amoeboformis.AAC.1